MRIGIDIRPLSAGKNTGVEEYIRNLLPELFRLGEECEFFLLWNSFKKTLPAKIKKWEEFPNVKIFDYHFPNKILNGLIWSAGFPKLDRLLNKVNIFFFPNIIFSAVSKDVPYVLTFHDLSFEYFPKFFNPRRRLWHYMIDPRLQAKKAREIIAVSESTAQDLASLYKIDQNKINVINLGLANQFLAKQEVSGQQEEASVRSFYKIPKKPFILFLGTIEPRKNITFLIKVFENLKEKNKIPHALVIAGGSGWSNKKIFLKASQSPFANDIFFVGKIKNKDRTKLYKMADLFVFPSLFEGFGLPPLEAMAAGTPVVASLNSSHIETIGDSALLANPHDIGEFSYACHEILTNTSLREEITKKGIENAKKYTWEKAAKKTLEVFERASSKGSQDDNSNLKVQM